MHYSVGEGLPQSQVYALHKDSRGFLWIGTQGGGLSRFDGREFETVGAGEGLPSGYVNALFEDADHRLWIGTDRGLAWFDGRVVHPVPPPPNQEQPVISALAAHPGTGALLVGTSGGLFTLDGPGHALKPSDAVPALRGAAVLAMCPGDRGLWIGTDRGAWRLDAGGQTIRLDRTHGLPGNAVRAVAADRRGRLWLALPGNGVAVIDETTLQVVALRQETQVRRPVCLMRGAGDVMWIGTQDHGLVLASPYDSTLRVLGEADGLAHSNVRALLDDGSGQVWIGTSGGGLARYLGQRFFHFDRGNGLAGDRIYALCEDRAGRLWVSVGPHGLHYLDFSGFHRFPAADSSLASVACKSLATDDRGRLWAATEGRGLVVFHAGQTHVLTQAGGLPSDWIRKVLPLSDGTVWLATYADGLARVQFRGPGDWTCTALGLRHGVPNLQITTLAADRYGTVWFATAAGQVGRIDGAGNRAIAYARQHGLPGVAVTALAFDSLGRLWAGTRGAGLFCADPAGAGNVQFRRAGDEQAQALSNIYLLVIDRGGNVWAGTERGVVFLELDGATGAVRRTRRYGASEGFLGIETCHNAGLCDRGGNLWFGTLAGLNKHVPAIRPESPSAPVLHFTGIELFYRPLETTAYAAWRDPAGGLSPGLELPYAKNHLSFGFRAVDLQHPAELRYRWMLVGAETQWSPWSSQLHVDYSNLAPGDYRFVVQARSDDGLESLPIEAGFRIRRPLWQHWWFWLPLSFALAAAGAWLLRWYLGRVRRTERAQREALEVRHRLLQLEQKALQLQMNPHFIFNALNSIQALIATQDYAAARQDIHAFARLMRSILANSRRQTISLREEIDTLDQYLRVEQFCHGQKFDFHIELAPGIDAEEVELPPMLLQPFVENAVVHGVAPLSHRGQIYVRFSVENCLLTCTIRDNGVGRARAARLREARAPGHQPVAVQVTAERLDALRAQHAYTALTIEDVVEPDGTIAGTDVTVRVPVILGY